MPLLTRIILVFALLITGLHAQTKNVLKNVSGNTITESLTIGAGKTLTIASGATIVAASGSTITGFGSGSGSGSVTSVALSLPSIFTVTGSPVTESGTLTGTLATQTANTIFAGPTTGSAAAPTFRALVASDLPDLSGTYQPLNSRLTTLSDGFGASFLGSGILRWTGSTYALQLDAIPANVGGTGLTSYTLGDIIYAASSGSITSLTRLPGNTENGVRKFLTQTGAAFGQSAAPIWATIASTDLADSIITSAKIADGTIVNADINASAAIAGTKVDAATTTTRGTVELATDGETSASVAVQGNDARLANANRVEIGLAISDETSDNTASSTTPKVTFRMPYAMTLTGVRCSLTKAATGALFIVDIHESGTTIMSTNKLSVDASETTSTTAATAAGITDSALADDAIIEIFIDQVGTTTDNTGEGVKVWLIGTR